MTTDRVVVVGGGLAGITAALRLAEAGLPVTLLEARPWLGGATWSFGRRGLTIDNGQHAFLRCFSAYRGLLDTLGVSGLAPIQDRLDMTVLTPDGPAGAQLRLTRSSWPAPLHLAPILARYRRLTIWERFGVLPAALALWLTDLSGSSHAQYSMGEWLARHGQGKRARTEFWDMFLLPFLNARADQADLGTAASFVNTALLSGRNRSDPGLASVPLRDLHARPAARRLAELGTKVRLGVEVVTIRRETGGGYVVRLVSAQSAAAGPEAHRERGPEDRGSVRAAAVVLAVPAWTASKLAPPELAAQSTAWSRLEPSPVVSIHVMYDIAVTNLPYAAVVGSPLRWIADKTSSAGLRTGQYLAASLPAAGRYVDAPAVSLRERFLPELERIFPAAGSAQVEDFFVTRERRATIRPAPGSRAIRPAQGTGVERFALAGAWTSTGWPDTMEGAVRSGMLAADAILRDLSGRQARDSRQPRQRGAAEQRASSPAGSDARVAADAGAVASATAPASTSGHGQVGHQ